MRCVKKKDVPGNNLTRKQVDRAVNYLLLYSLFVVIGIGILVMKFLAPIARSIAIR